MNGFDKMISNPLFHMGLGGLLNQGNLAKGIPQGLQSYAGYQQGLLAQQEAEQEREDRQRQMQAMMSMGLNPYLPKEMNQTMLEQRLKGNEAPKTTGGLMWNKQTGKWEQIPGWQPGIQVNTGEKLRSVPDELMLESLMGQGEMYREKAMQATKSLERTRKGFELMKRGMTGRWKPFVGAAAAYIDSSSEAAQDYDMWRDYATEQALDTLQLFSGPTTDFEYNVARSLAAQQGKTDFANYVALKAAERAALRDRKRNTAYMEWTRGAYRTAPDFEEWFATKLDKRLQPWSLDQFQESYNRWAPERRKTPRQRAIDEGYMRSE